MSLVDACRSIEDENGEFSKKELRKLANEIVVASGTNKYDTDQVISQGEGPLLNQKKYGFL